MVVGAQEKPEVVFGTRPVVWMMLGAKCECSICSPVPLPIKSLPRNCGDLRHLNSNQWEFQDPKLEVPTIYKAYIRPM